jgi:hypothetical protein
MPDMRPALPVAVDNDTKRVRISPTGVREAEYNLTYTEYDAGRIQAGYCCIECGEAHEEAYPVKCNGCAFPMRRDQAQKYAEQFEGYTTIGPAKSLAELRAEDEEAKERAWRAKAKPTSSIIVPNWVSRAS